MLKLLRIRLLAVACLLLAAAAAICTAAGTIPQPRLQRLPPVAFRHSVSPTGFVETTEPTGNLSGHGEPGEDQDASWLFGDFRVRPYGVFWADMVYATQRTNPGAFSRFVFSKDDQDEDAFVIDGRRTRLGLHVDGPSLARFHGAQSGGRVEIDFHGDFITENERRPRLPCDVGLLHSHNRAGSMANHRLSHASHQEMKLGQNGEVRGDDVAVLS